MNELELYNVSVSPHTRQKDTTATIMRDVAIALIPASLFGVYNFGLPALIILVTSVATSVLAEYVWQKLMKQPVRTGDCSALVTGLLLGLNMPATVPIWLVMLGDIFAIIVVKQLFGGLGQNFVNPALAARCFLLISFASRMTTYPALDGVSGPTPLQLVKAGEAVNLSNMFLGRVSGVIGETSVIAILIGAAYMLARRVISLRIPLCYLLSFSVLILLIGGRGFDLHYLAAQLCGGGLMLGAFFMATDYVTCPVTKTGRIVYGIFLGCMTAVFRKFGGAGVSYAILLGNLMVPLIEKITMPVPFGMKGKVVKR
ncbi:RnfABCDGE type electron transport complex subunit D [Anaerolentibacter hominis]|uniref:RnfABCDGE type electron transport complex subunit D n=1 Tax=Anaerolentibacter hominis TaxID=3079009 RepID=UPI0031B7EC1C